MIHFINYIKRVNISSKTLCFVFINQYELLNNDHPFWGALTYLSINSTIPYFLTSFIKPSNPSIPKPWTTLIAAMDLNSTLSLLGLTTPVPSPNPGSSSGFCEICQKHVSNRTNHKFVHSHVSQVWRLLLQEFCLSRVCELRFLCVFNCLTSTSWEWSGTMVSARYFVGEKTENF